MELSALDRMTAFGDNEVCSYCEQTVRKEGFKEHVVVLHRDRERPQIKRFKKETPITETSTQRKRREALEMKLRELEEEKFKEMREIKFTKDSDAGLYRSGGRSLAVGGSTQ